MIPPTGKAQSPRAPAVAPAGSPRPPAATQPETSAPRTRADGAVTVRGSDTEPPEGGWDSADTVTSFPHPGTLPEPSRDVPQVNVREIAPVSTTSPSFTVPTAASPGRERTAAQAMQGAIAPVNRAAGPPTTQAAPATHAAPTAQSVPATSKMSGPGSAALGASMREEVWAIVRAAVNEATAPLLARNKELEARIDRAEKEIIARTTGQGQSQARSATSAMQTTAPLLAAAAAPATTGSASARLASIPVTTGPSLVPAPLVAPAPQLAEAPPASVTRPEFRIDAPVVLPGPRASIPPQGLGVAVMTATRPSLDLDAVGAVDVSEFDGGRKKRMVARVVVVILLAIVTGSVIAMIASRS